MKRLNRRRWLTQSAQLGAAGLSLPLLPARAHQQRKKLPVAAVVTVYRENSHADVIVGKILDGFRQDGGAGPDLELASLYVDQRPGNDLSQSLAKKHGFRLARSIPEALTLGTNKLAVKGVLSIGEHGDYPYTEDTHQHMYPRRRFFDQITKTFQQHEQVVPLFNDKHLAYRWADAEHMYKTAKAMEIPFLAGSSLPVAWRVPPLQLPRGCQIEEALAIGYGGPESYGFHALETLQCMVERRRGGETGVKRIQAVQGDAIWQAERDGRWSRELFEAALAAMPDVREGKPEERLGKRAAFYLLEYRDGLQATVAMASGLARHFGFACKLKGKDQPVATWFKLEDEKPYGHFAYLLRAIEHTIHTGTPAYPVERTLLTTGVLDALMHSLAADGKARATPHLAIQYQPTDWGFAGEE